MGKQEVNSASSGGRMKVFALGLVDTELANNYALRKARPHSACVSANSHCACTNASPDRSRRRSTMPRRSLDMRAFYRADDRLSAWLLRLPSGNGQWHLK
jgi:hypothetical protein